MTYIYMLAILMSVNNCRSFKAKTNRELPAPDTLQLLAGREKKFWDRTPVVRGNAFKDYYKDNVSWVFKRDRQMKEFYYDNTGKAMRREFRYGDVIISDIEFRITGDTLFLAGVDEVYKISRLTNDSLIVNRITKNGPGRSILFVRSSDQRSDVVPFFRRKAVGRR
jgi:hypothetical protein